jgi:gamma-tubulin complex component 2
MAMENQLDPETAAMAPANQIQLMEQAMKRLNEFEDGFVYHIKLLIDALNFYSATETVQYLCLVVRLDYNQFYANQTGASLYLAANPSSQ